MELKIIEEKTNKLLNREEVKFEIIHENEPTPSRDKTREIVSKKIKSNPKFTVIQFISSIFGYGKSMGLAHIYKKKEHMLKHEPKYTLLRNKLIITPGEEKKEEVKKEKAPKKEPKKEEVKEEVKKEKKEDKK